MASLRPGDVDERKSGPLPLPELSSCSFSPLLGQKIGTAWSPLASGDLRDPPPRSRWLPTSQGWTSTSSVLILSPGSLRSKHRIRHLAREESESGREK